MAKEKKGSKLGKQGDRAAARAQVISDIAVSEEDIKNSHLYRSLTAMKYPHELAMIHGLHDVQIGMALQSVTNNLLWSQEFRFAQAQIDSFKSNLWMKGETEDAIAAAVINQQSQGFLPLPPHAPPPPPPAGLTFPIAAGTPTIAARDAVYLTTTTTTTGAVITQAALGQGMPGASYLLTPNPLLNIVGITVSVTGPSILMAYPGMLVGGFTNLVPGTQYCVGLDGSILPLGLPSSNPPGPAGTFAAQCGAEGAGVYWTRYIGLAMSATVMLVQLGAPFDVTVT